uniref:Calcium dependent mitochondrial carrier protein n=1 Tax=Ganoderma boninense TaxID=34458 RepID=A0A5K1K5H1_9APHY|nr:Calcium dependent mitochondrial carrier protein [Ganoderma boninense]
MDALHTIIRLPLYDSGMVRSADPIVAELLVVSLMTLGTIPLVLSTRKGWVPNFNFLTSTASRNLVELGGLSVLWLLWLVGCVVSTSIWPDLSFCYQFEPCRILTAMMAFAWLGWIVVVGLIVVAILSTVAKVRPTRAPMTVEWASPSNMARSVTV